MISVLLFLIEAFLWVLTIIFMLMVLYKVGCGIGRLFYLAFGWIWDPYYKENRK